MARLIHAVVRATAAPVYDPRACADVPGVLFRAPAHCARSMERTASENPVIVVEHCCYPIAPVAT
eukprot:2355366-Lingulodinium_polyedra.AAC.1